MHGDDKAWIDVLRLIEDYTSGPNFDPEKDRHVGFPTLAGWETRADIQFQHANLGAATSDPGISRRAVNQTMWQKATIEIIGEETNLKEDIDFDDISEKTDLSLLFTDDPFDKNTENLTFSSK